MNKHEHNSFYTVFSTFWDDFATLYLESINKMVSHPNLELCITIAFVHITLLQSSSS